MSATTGVRDPGAAVDWYRVPLPPGRLQELNRRSDLRGLAQAGGHTLLMVATGAAAIWAWTHAAWGWMALALFAHGTVCSFMINGIHEMVHGTVFRSRWLNAFFVHLFAFVGWENHRLFWASHARHHTFTLHDPHDSEVVVPIRYTLWDLLRGAVINPLLMWHQARGHCRLAAGHLDGDWNQHILGDDPERHAVFAWSRMLIAGHVAVAGVALWFGWWIVPVVVSLTPMYARGLQFLLNQTQHVGLQDHVTDFRLNCRTFTCNPLFRFLYWHMNYHIEHHMYAAVPCYRLGALHREVRHALPYTFRGVRETWTHIIAVLYRQREDPDYQYVPLLPEQAPDGVDVQAAPRSLENIAGGSRAQRPAPEAPAAAAATERRRVWRCSICGFIYDEALGLPAEGIAPGTPWDAIPDDWTCPDCGVSKADFRMVEIDRPLATTADTATEETRDDDRAPVVIVGTGLAGYTLAKELRARDPQRAITLVTADDGAFVSKPMLSNALAQGRTPADLVQADAASMAREYRLDIRTGVRVQGIDRDGRRLASSEGDIAYGDLVLATGAAPAPLPLPGEAARDVFRVNNLADYTTFREHLHAHARVLLIGAGLIGCEFANDLAAAGHGVHVVDPAPHPLARLVPPLAGERLRAALTTAGVDWHLATTLERIDRDGAGYLCTLSDGTTCRVDVLLAAIGLKPAIELADAAGLAADAGVAVDRELRTADPHVFALGDCAAIAGRQRPFILPIMHASRALAATLAGTPTAMPEQPLPITVKTPACPLVVVPPASATPGDWRVIADAGEDAAPHLVAHCHDDAGRLTGGVLLGGAVDMQDDLIAAVTDAAASAEPPAPAHTQG